MADYALIDDYLATLRKRVRWRRDLDDLVAEVRDHLYSAVEGLEGRGTEGESAQQETLERFGDPELITRALAAAPKGGLAVPTRFTRKAGSLGIAAGVLWPATVGLWWLAGVAEPWGEVDYDSINKASGVFYGIGAATLLGACALSFVTFLAIQQRHGGLGMMGRVGLVFTAIGVIGALAAWVFMGWGLMFMIGTVLLGYALLDQDVAPRWASWALTVGVVLGAVTWVVLRSADRTLLQFGGLWGEWIPNLAGVSVAAVIMGVSLVGLGDWMRAETPADITDQDQAVTV